MSDFTVKIEKYEPDNSITVLKIIGELEVKTVPELEESINGLFQQGLYKIIIDMKELTYTNSAGIGLIINSMRHARSNQGDIKMLAVQPKILYILSLFGFSSVFTIYDSIESAVSDFNA